MTHREIVPYDHHLNQCCLKDLLEAHFKQIPFAIQTSSFKKHICKYLQNTYGVHLSGNLCVHHLPIIC